MGAWGTGAFENDDALDWLGDLAGGDWGPVEEALYEVELGQPPAPACTRALAAAELVAAGRGHPHKDLPETALQFLVTAGTPPPDALVSRTIAAVEAVGRASELRELFKEGDGLKPWSAELRRLARRLAKPLLPAKIDRIPPSVENLWKRCVRQMTAERWEEALATVNQLLERDPDNKVLCLSNRAWCLAHVGGLTEAAADIETALELNKRVESPTLLKGACHGTRGYIHLQQQNYRKAIDDLSIAIDRDSEVLDFEFRAQAYEALGEHALAATDRQSARVLLVENGLKRAHSAHEDERNREALIELNRVIEIAPENERALFQRAMALWELKRMEEAERDLSKLIEIKPQERFLYFRRAEVRAILGKREAAREDRVRCHELGLDVIEYEDDFVADHALTLMTFSPARVKAIKASVIPQLTFLLKTVPEHTAAREVRAMAFELVGNPRRAAQDRKMIHSVKPLPPAAPAPDDMTFGRWFWKMMRPSEE